MFETFCASSGEHADGLPGLTLRRPLAVLVLRPLLSALLLLHVVDGHGAKDGVAKTPTHHVHHVAHTVRHGLGKVNYTGVKTRFQV